MREPQAKHSSADFFRMMLAGSAEQPVNMAETKARLRVNGVNLDDLEIEKAVLREANLAGRAIEFQTQRPFGEEERATMQKARSIQVGRQLRPASRDSGRRR